MKKKLLFVIPSLALGGAEKSFVNLLNSLNLEKYEVDVFLFVKSGEFLELLPKNVNVLPVSENFEIFSSPFFTSIITFLKRGNLILAINRIMFFLGNTWARNPSISEQFTWKYLKTFLPKIDKKYDVAIGYLEKSSNYFVIDNVLADRKLGWIHTDIKALQLNFDYEKKYFKKLEKIITVSEVLVEKLQEYFPETKEKFICIENINSSKTILDLASKNQSLIKKNDGVFNIIFVGRLVKEKALYLAIEALEILLKKNYKIKLYLVGDGNKREELETLAKERYISENIIFLGVQSNPYPLINAADLFLMTSVFEGKSIALEEAKILKKPIVITNFSTATEQITDGKTGLIAEMNANSIAQKIEKIYLEKDFENTLIQNLNLEKLGNESEIEKFEILLDYNNTKPISLKLRTKLVYGFNRALNFLVKLKIYDTSTSIDLLNNNNFSLARYGDGELNIMMGGDIHFQKYDYKLAQRLKNILLNYNSKENFKIGIPLAINTVLDYKPDVKKFWNMNMDTGRFHWIKYCGIKERYFNASLTRCYIDYEDKSKSKIWFKSVMQLWNDKKILIVEGETSKLGMQNTLFSNARTIKRIITLPENAWSKYEEIKIVTLNNAANYDLILVSLGPTATVLAADISAKGFRIIDIGHLNLEFDKYKAEEKGDFVGKITEEEYQSQIICKIL